MKAEMGLLCSNVWYSIPTLWKKNHDTTNSFDLDSTSWSIIKQNIDYFERQKSNRTACGSRIKTGDGSSSCLSSVSEPDEEPEEEFELEELLDILKPFIKRFFHFPVIWVFTAPH